MSKVGPSIRDSHTLLLRKLTAADLLLNNIEHLLTVTKNRLAQGANLPNQRQFVETILLDIKNVRQIIYNGEASNGNQPS